MLLQGFQLSEKPRAILVSQRRFILGRHFQVLDDLDHVVEQLRLGQQLRRADEFLEIDLSLGFFTAVALDALRVEQRLDERIEGVCRPRLEGNASE